MKRILFTSVLLLLTPILLFAQDDYDPKAKAILDEVSKKTKTYTSLKVKFEYIMENIKEDIRESQIGELTLKGTMYKLKISGQEVFSNGKTMWTYIEDADEVQINEPETKEGSISPSNIFTIYEKGFKYKYSKEITVDGKIMQVINLFPEKAGEKSYHTIKLYVDKVKKQIASIRIKGKEGDDYIYKVMDLKTNFPIKDSDFTFNTADYPGIEVVDLR